MSGGKRLCLGPGRPHQLETLLRAQGPGGAIQRLTDLAELLQSSTGHAVLDGALIPPEDLGILRRALSGGELNITLLGGDPSAGALRELLKHPCASWVPYPPDSEELAQLLNPLPTHMGHAAPAATEPAAQGAPAADPRQPTENALSQQIQRSPANPTPETEPVGVPTDPNLAEVEAILSRPAAVFQAEEGVAQVGPLEQDTGHPERTRRDTPQPPQATPPAEPAPKAPEEAASRSDDGPQTDLHTEPTWFKDQVADLADIVQVIYATATTAQEDDAGSPPSLLNDAMRLVQFTRTLGFLASPPARGQTHFDLGDLSEELLRGAGAASDAPRLLLKIAEPLPVRGDKELVVQALDAFLALARLCAGPEGEVRLSGQRDPEGGSILLLGFPRGPLGELEPSEIMTPYTLRSILPDMGKNALRAASRIIEGQGGAAALRDSGDGKMQLEVVLPAP